MAIIFGLLTILAFVMGIFTIVATVQIIVKAGYSGWWILVPLGAPVVALIATSIVAASTVDLGSRSVSSAFDALAVGIVIDFLIYAAVWGCFIKFAFSDWPVLQAARARRAPAMNPYVGRPGSYPPQPPPGRPARASGLFPGVAPPPPMATGARPIGWHRVDESNDEQYWDGRTWTARRRQDADGGYVIVPISD